MSETLEEISWKYFEKAVAQFLKALDPEANVKHDVKLLDSHTNTPRQRDVWVETKVCNHFPIKILISCKKYKRKINQLDIDAFNGEFISSSAQVGVIYSYSGFGKKAIDKAKTLGFHCCRLFLDQPADLPEEIVHINSFCSTPKLSFAIFDPIDPKWNFVTWNDLFSYEIEENEEPIKLIDSIVKNYKSAEEKAIQMATENFFPPPWSIRIEIKDDEGNKEKLKIVVGGGWNVYKGSLKAQLINGSYNFSSGCFNGSVSTPSLDTHQMHPGKDWTLLEKLPTNEELEKIPLRTMFFKTLGNAKSVLLGRLGPTKIPPKYTKKNV
jgi:hypothetical protein